MQSSRYAAFQKVERNKPRTGGEVDVPVELDSLTVCSEPRFPRNLFMITCTGSLRCLWSGALRLVGGATSVHPCIQAQWIAAILRRAAVALNNYEGVVARHPQGHSDVTSTKDGATRERCSKAKVNIRCCQS